MGAVLNGRRSFNGASDRLTIGMVSHQKTLDVKWDGHGFRSGGVVTAVGGEARGQHDALLKKWQVGTGREIGVISQSVAYLIIANRQSDM